ncbi:MAG: TerB family tellurite resistance protein [Planctomycetota bacterium]|nr:MAG: TerB family tellurite resistance protein [Planctomycetota bacterium]
MGALLEQILKSPGVAEVAGFVRGIFFRFSHEADETGSLMAPPDLSVLNCRVHLTRHKAGNWLSDAFGVEICGSIHAPSDMHNTAVRVFIKDVTDGAGKAGEVRARVQRQQIEESSVFCYTAELGKLPTADSTWSDWISVAQIPVEWLEFARKGDRKLQFIVVMISAETGGQLDCARCYFTYENFARGYLDLQDNVQRAKTLAVALGFAVSAADKKVHDAEVALIREWAGANIDLSGAPEKARRKFKKALDKTIKFFRKGNQINPYKICREIVEIAPVAERYDILEFCMWVARANGVAATEEVALLRDIADWLELDGERFRTMMGKILPVGMHEVEDAEAILGVRSDMSEEETRGRLTEEYRKWNARVTNFDPEVQSQADQMLRFIAEARDEYVS